MQAEGQPATYALEGSVAVAGLALRSGSSSSNYCLPTATFPLFRSILSSCSVSSFVSPFLPPSASSRWLRDNMKMIEDYSQAYELAAEVLAPSSP